MSYIKDNIIESDSFIPFLVSGMFILICVLAAIYHGLITSWIGMALLIVLGIMYFILGGLCFEKLMEERRLKNEPTRPE